MTARLPLKLGSSDARGDDVTHWQRWATQYASAYAHLLGPVDGYYGNSDAAFTREMQRRLGIPQTGIFDEPTAGRVGYKGVAPAPRRKIWIYTAPGSGAPWWIGPSFEVGEWAKHVLKLQHQPIGFPMGGYLGLLGGDPGLSYLEVIHGLGVELERLLDTNPDIADPDLELWFSGYSQSADGIEDAVARLFGDGGKYEHLRGRINGLIQFGSPSKQPGPTKTGNNPKGWGISRKVRPAWLAALTWSITANGDVYACTTDNTLLPLFYEWFVLAETELSFAAYSAGIVIPALASYMDLVGPLIGPALAGMVGMSLSMMGALIQGYGGGPSPNPELIEALSAKGLLTAQGIGKVLATLAALPGVITHGEYHLPKPEFGGRTGIQVGCDTLAAFRR